MLKAPITSLLKKTAVSNLLKINTLKYSTTSIQSSILQHKSVSITWLPKQIPFQNRSFSTTLLAKHGHLTKPKEGEELNITFVLKDGQQKSFEVAEGDTLLDIAQGNNLDMEGACGGSCACSTCHVIVDPDYYDAIPEPEDDENDMLDLAYGLTETSRLGCQVKMSKDIDGIRVALPQMTRNVSNNDFDQ